MANILLAEDDGATRKFLSGALERAGHRVTSCIDGLEAIVALEEGTEDFDLLLTDIVMPGLDGLELSARATALYPKMRIILLTGFAAMAVGNHAAARPQTRLISKPFHLNQLTSQIEEILGAAA